MSDLNPTAKPFRRRHILVFLLLTLIASIAIGKLAGVFGRMQHSVCVTAVSSDSGITQLFYSDRAAEFSEENSQSAIIHAGQQKVCFTTGTGAKFLRWDPNNNPATMVVKRITINFWGLKQKLDLQQLEPSLSVSKTPDSESDTAYAFNDNDPQIYFTLPSTFSHIENLACVLILWLSLTTTAVFTGHVFKEALLRKKPAYLMGVFTVIALILVYQITGKIAVNDGAGWDGQTYLGLLVQWKNTGVVPNDPYRISRIIGFLPLVLAEFSFGLSISKLIVMQTVLNIVGIGIGVGFFMDYLLKCGLPLKRAFQYSVLLLASWPVLVMSTYYPILSDHLAIILTCVGLWCHVEKRFLGLAAICAISPFIMPGYFLVPFILLCLPNQPQALTAFSRFSLSTKWRIATFVALSIAMILYVVTWMLKIDDDTLLHKGLYLTPAWLDLRLVSSVLVVAALVVIAWAWSSQLKNNGIFAHFSMKWSLLAVGAVAVGHAALYIGLDWNSGFRGPPLIENMLYQALNAPLKPLAAHFVFFGPVFVATLFLLFKAQQPTNTTYAIKAILLAFMPIFAIGSESRQWISVLPLFFAFAAQSNISDVRTRLLLWFSALMALPLFWLANSVADASSSGLPMSDLKWQLYFGRQGPWMSQPVYLSSLAIMFVFVTLWFWPTVKSDKKALAQ
ncbi:Uncharacterised protein [Pseudomonas fluorescens]|uniref:Uncharacterized protein n=1 Tax=Pseudomonas fluorescens TaxID=294 RepID=A0A448DZD6_PSEFL|nr:hypothetical protein [Pseudomonas fluorescens]VEF12179.1 Uncharacterised protein [Pseudomonas fluorescens]